MIGDRLIRLTTAVAVATVAAVAAVISYRHAYELVSTHGETGMTARPGAGWILRTPYDPYSN